MDKKSIFLGLLIGLLVVPAVTIGATLITNSMIADKSISSRNLGYGSVTRNAIKNGAVSGAKIAAGTITNSRLADNSFSASKLGKSCVTSSKIADGAVTGAELDVSALNATKYWATFFGGAVIDFPNIVSQSCATNTVTVTGISTSLFNGVVASPTPTTGGIDTMNLTWNAWISADDTVTIRVCNPTSGALNPTSQWWDVYVLW